jgi:Tfp pilus assembly protein PilF
MHARPLAVAFLLALTTFGTPSARAQGADEESTKAARARFQEGVEYYDKGQYEKARAAFLQAYALRKHPAVLLNLAQSSLKSGHQLEAVRDFQQFLRESTSISASQRSDAERGINEARQKLGRIEVVSAPTGAEITIDNTAVGTAPLSDHRRRAGKPHGPDEIPRWNHRDEERVSGAGGAREGAIQRRDGRRWWRCK